MSKVEVILILQLLLFPVLWCTIIASISQFGGWKELANRHRRDRMQTNPIRTYRFQSLTFGAFFSYNNAISIELFEWGIVLRPFWLFSYNHPELTFSWNMMTNVTHSKSKFSCYIDSKKISFYGKVAQELALRFPAG